MRRIRDRARRVRQRLRALRFVLFRVLLLVVFVAALYFGLRAAGVDLSVESIEDFGEELGLAGWIAYVPAAILLNCVWLLAIPIAAAGAGLLFGKVAGTALTILVAGGAAGLQNEIGRRWVGERAEHLLGERGKRLDKLLDERGFEAMLYLRLTPLTPFTALNYASGLTRLTPGAIALASAIAMGPRIWAYSVLGGNLDDPFSEDNILPVAVIVAGGVAGVGLIVRAVARSRRA